MYMPQKSAVTINGTNLYYEIAGKGKTIVLLHGFSLDTRMWDDQFSVLSEKFQVLRYDMRGFGQSNTPTSEVYSHTDDLKSLLDFLGIETATIVGLSRGGRWAIEFALDFQEKVQSLILADSMPYGFDALENRPSLSDEIVSTAKLKGMNAARKLWFEHPIFENARTNLTVSERVWAMISDYSGWHWINNDPVQNRFPPAAKRLDNLSIPTLVIVGEYDLPVFRKSAEFLKQNIKNSRMVVIPNAGHLSNMEAPTIFNNAILKFDGNLR
jgi:3-oxoadipate enol-lactonase